MGGYLTQVFPPSPTFTEKNLSSLAGKVIITGGNAGVGLGLELVKILYSKDARVYIAGRNSSKAATEIESIKSSYPASARHIESLPLDLSDLTTIQKCGSAFLARESRLDVLWNNAGIAHVPTSSISAQGHEAHIATNCLGAYLLTTFLLPVFI
jgi:NAD(P)-dependent dehydrogenase (short-subunit alcohol dehydrogenase family)